MKNRLPLKPYQIKGAKFCIQNPYTILAMDMGTGKSLTALAVWRKVGGKLLIVCPSYLILNWKSEIKKWFGDHYLITTISTGKDIYEVWDSDIVIVSYDLATKAENFFDWADFVIGDEFHMMKNMKAKKTQFIHKAIFEYSIPRVLMLTGTPIQNRVEEFYSLIALAHYNPAAKDTSFLDEFPDSVTFADQFSHRHEFKINMVKKNGGQFKFNVVKWAGFKNVKQLKEILAPIYFRVKADDVLDLPPVTFKDILMSEIPDKELEALFEKLDGLYNGDDEAYKKVSIERKVQSAIEKVPFTIKYAKAILEERGSVIIYTDHVAPCQMLAETFGVTPIHADTPKKKRHEIGVAFQNGEIKVIVATYGSFSTGITLTASQDIVTNDRPWVPGVYSQAVARIHRLTQEKKCRIHNIYGSPQDARIGAAMAEKEKTIKVVT